MIQRLPPGTARPIVAAAIVLGIAGCASSGSGGPRPTEPATGPTTTGTVTDPSVTVERIALIRPAEREAWTRYLEASGRQMEIDRASIATEMAAAGLPERIPVPEGSFSITPEMTDAWFAGPEARRIAENILSFQTPSGGWSKNIDHRKEPRSRGQGYATGTGWSYVGTIDNSATTEHIRFVARAFGATADQRYRSALLRGIDYLLRAQYPNGCWPQVYPLQGSYHDAVTYNDDAMVRVLELLWEISRGGAFDLVPTETRARAGAAVERGIGCIVSSQVVVNGKLTAWGAQHDPLTLAPAKARTYEHASLTGAESVGIVRFLMGLPAPDERVIRAVDGAVGWFRAVAVPDREYVKGELITRSGAGPVWARFYEIGTNRPIFSNRDGVVRYDWSELVEERRTGYAWYTNRPTQMLREYERWRASLRR